MSWSYGLTNQSKKIRADQEDRSQLLAVPEEQQQR